MTIPLPFIPLLCLLIMSRLGFGCPPSCTCKWRNGKQTVECVNKSLIIIPEGMDPASQVLDLSGNNFDYLQQEKFLTLGLVNLQKIFLNECNIKTIQSEAFKGLTNLVELDLSENYLETVPTAALLNCPSIMKLSLSKNPINSLNRLAFNHLSFLTTLDVSGCKIAAVHEAAFNGLYSLEWLDLSQNQITFFPDMRLFPNTLKGVQLQGNPWTCDCHLRTLNSWLKRDIVPILASPICQIPSKFKDLPVRALDVADLACAPEVSPNNFYFELEENINITLVCQVKAVPAATISWLFKGQVLHNNTELAPGLRLVYFIEESGEEKQSNLYIYNVNSEDNGTFYCQAENPAGVAYANYTIMIILKRKPMAIAETPEFPIEILSALFAAGLVILSLCFVALVMTLIRCQTESKHRKQRSDNKDKFIAETKCDVSEKSNFKTIDKRKGISQVSINNGNGTTDFCYQVPESNPDIINVINSKEIPDSRNGVLGIKLANNLGLIDNSFGSSEATIRTKQSIKLSDTTLARSNVNRQRTQSYLKPTLTSQLRPVSAPSFERFVEKCDVRYTADGYPLPKVEVLESSTVMASFSEASTPRYKMKHQTEKLNNLVAQTHEKHKMRIFDVV